MGCEQVDKWMIDHKIDLGKFQSRYYVRLKQLRYLLDRNALDAELRFTNA